MTEVHSTSSKARRGRSGSGGKGHLGCAAIATALTTSSEQTAGKHRITRKRKRNPTPAKYTVTIVATDAAKYVSALRTLTLTVTR